MSRQQKKAKENMTASTIEYGLIIPLMSGNFATSFTYKVIKSCLGGYLTITGVSASASAVKIHKLHYIFIG